MVRQADIQKTGWNQKQWDIVLVHHIRHKHTDPTAHTPTKTETENGIKKGGFKNYKKRGRRRQKRQGTKYRDSGSLVGTDRSKNGFNDNNSYSEGINAKQYGIGYIMINDGG